MTETSYFRVNFSSAISTRKEYDVNGKRIAKLDVELPGPLLDPTNSFRSVEMVLTKASIPLSMLPILRLKVEEIDKYSDTTYSLNTYNTFFYGPLFYSGFLLSRNGKALYTNQTSVDAINFFKHFIRLGVDRETNNIGDLVREFLPYYSYTKLSLFENDVNQTLMGRINILKNMVFPSIRFHFEDNHIRIYFSREAVHEGQTLMQPLYGTGDPSLNTNFFSLLMSKENAEIFHNLPLVDISKYYGKMDNLEDPGYFRRWAQYALDLEGRVPDGALFESGKEWIYFDFHFFNPISLSPLSSIIIYSQDLPLLSQVHGIVSPIINYHTSSVGDAALVSFDASSSTQIGSLPIIDVFYPLITSEKDFQDVLIVSKDAVSNTGPVLLNSNSLAQVRNITFNIGYITKDGVLYPLLIPENSNLSIQLTFILKK